MKHLYIFLDEGGNFDFSPKGTKYFTLTAVTKERPFEAYKALSNLKYDLVEQGIALEYFHAAEDRQQVRNGVFDIIATHLDGVQIDSVIVEKSKTAPVLQDVVKFYPKMMGHLLRYILGCYEFSQITEVFVFTDAIPVAKRKEAIKKAIREVLSEMLPQTAKYKIFHHDSKSDFDLQIVDYCNWAIFRKWTGNDCRSYTKIAAAIRSELDIFRMETNRYY